MKKVALLVAATAALSACAPAPPAPVPAAVLARPLDSIQPGFRPAEVRGDLEATARQRFGDALTDRALASDTYLFAKHFVGLAPPPIVEPDGSYRYPPPPMAMLIRENGQWLAATAAGFRAVSADKAAAIDALVRNAAFWSEPDYAEPGCTDAGASLLMLKAPPRPVVVRRGACGRTALTERLVFLALEA